MAEDVSLHTHRFTYLRQEIRTTKKSSSWRDSVLERAIEDIFFCEVCLEYRRVLVRLQEPEPHGYGWREVVT